MECSENLTFSLTMLGRSESGGGSAPFTRTLSLLSRLVPLKQDLRPQEYHHILAADVRCGWFIGD